MWQKVEVVCGHALGHKKRCARLIRAYTMNKDYLTYREILRIIPKEDLYQMVTLGILSPMEKTNSVQSWKFKKSELTDDLFKRLNYVRELGYQANLNELLADKVEHEWKPRSKR